MRTLAQESNQQKKIIEDTKKNIYRELNAWMNEEGVSESIEDRFLRKYVFQYLEWVIESNNYKNCERKMKNRLYLMSQLNDFESFE